MAIIGDIRRKGGLLIAIFVGVALLAFILGDFLGPGGSLASTEQFEIGEVDGEIIPAKYFEQEVQKAIENYKQQTNKTSLDQPTIDALREQEWSKLTNEIILGEEYKRNGIAVHPDEIFDLVTGETPHRSIVQAFTNPQTGQFNSQDVINFLKNMDKDETGKSRDQWLPFEQSITREHLLAKYLNAIKSGLYVTKTAAEKSFAAKNKSAKLQYILLRYGAVSDSLTPISEQDIQNYYDNNKEKFEQEATRTIKYIGYDVIPSQDDSLIVKEWIDGVKDEIGSIENEEDVRSFVNMSADTRYTDKFVGAGTLEKEADSVLFASGKNAVFGPYLENGSYKVIKVVDLQERPDSVKARHILSKFKTGNDSAHIVRADSIMSLIENGGDFESLAKTLSEDEGSAQNGGDLGWFAEGTMVKPFNDSCFAGKSGDLFVTHTQFGTHIIEILETTDPINKAKFAIIDRLIEPSSKTFASVYAKANRFAGTNTNVESFETSSKEQGIVPRIAENIKPTDKTIVGLDAPREIIRWAYKVEEGTISGPFELGNKFVIAALTTIKEEGVSSLDQIRTEMEIGARNKKKFEYIVEKIKETGDQDINDLTLNLSNNIPAFNNLSIKSLDALSFSSFTVPSVGREPEFIGTVFGSPTGTLSDPLEGNTGVFVFVVDEFVPGAEIQDFSPIKAQLSQDNQRRVDYEVLNALKERLDIVDNRHNFY